MSNPIIWKEDYTAKAYDLFLWQTKAGVTESLANLNWILLANTVAEKLYNYAVRLGIDWKQMRGYWSHHSAGIFETEDKDLTGRNKHLLH